MSNDMNPDDDIHLGPNDTSDTSDGMTPDSGHPAGSGARVPRVQRMLDKIPVRLTLEVGSATLPLSELIGLEHGSVLELDRLAGEPLVIKVNGTAIGTAEVVVSGENYGLKIVALDDLKTLAQ
jgi:flagellar motor switch protein FliN/FliY